MQMAYRAQAKLTVKRHVERERAAQRRLTGKLMWAYRECLAAGTPEGACWRRVERYRWCLEAGGRDAQCRGRP